MSKISKSEIREGDKITVSYVTKNVIVTRTGVVKHFSVLSQDWFSEEGAGFNTYISDAEITLLERQPTVEEILMDRRDRTVRDLMEDEKAAYRFASTLSQRAVDRIIALEDEVDAK